MEYLSQERYNELAEELNRLINVDFPRLTQELSDARAQGDLSENFEYHACKREQGKMVGRIRFLQRVLQFAKVMDTSQLDNEVVGLFRQVTVTQLNNNKQRVYTIVNPHEADVAAGKLSVKSPIGQALNGHRVGDVVEVEAPVGVLSLRIEGIRI